MTSPEFADRIVIAKEFYDTLGRLDFARLASFLHPDVEASFPFGVDPTVVHGRDAILARLETGVPRVAEYINFHYDAFYVVAEPANFLIMEFRSEGRKPLNEDGSTGGPYAGQYVSIVGFEGDLIVKLWEYYRLDLGRAT